MFSFKTSDVMEKPWKKKKYEKTKGYSRQKLRKEDWMKKASAKEDRVFRYLLMMMFDEDDDDGDDDSGFVVDDRDLRRL